MKHLILTTFLICFYFYSANAFSYDVASFSSSVNTSEETHIFIIGYGHGMGDIFLNAAITKAKNIQRIYPRRQLVFIKIKEDSIRKEKKSLKI